MSTKTTKPIEIVAPEDGTKTDPLHLIDVDYVEIYVGNAKQAAFYYAYAFGFQVIQVT